MSQEGHKNIHEAFEATSLPEQLNWYHLFLSWTLAISQSVSAVSHNDMDLLKAVYDLNDLVKDLSKYLATLTVKVHDESRHYF